MKLAAKPSLVTAGYTLAVAITCVVWGCGDASEDTPGGSDAAVDVHADDSSLLDGSGLPDDAAAGDTSSSADAEGMSSSGDTAPEDTATGDAATGDTLTGGDSGGGDTVSPACPEGTSCDDGDLCTVGDVCKDGACVPGEQQSCDDDNPCTKDACDASVGCTKTNDDGLACDDNNACSVGDVCSGGVCAGNAPIDCDDGNPCTKESCDGAKGCEVVHDGGAACSDNSVCTVGDSCNGGACAPGAPQSCDDGNPCTKDACLPATGCTQTDDGGGDCDDGNACTKDDACKDGKCASVTAVSCDDNKVCTTDSCDPLKGCQNVNHVAPCDDGDACTPSDACKDGVCVGGPKTVCDDNNVCTTDACDAKSGCSYKPNQAKCSDGNACTKDDACKDGKCVVSSAISCDDGNACTVDSCLPASGCTYQVSTLPCSDGSACTIGDACKGKSCVAGASKDCDDGLTCTVDSCDPKTAKCSSVPAKDGLPCDADGSLCTVKDVCKSGACTKGPQKVCDDKETCTTDACDAKTGKCVFSAVKDSTSCDADGSLCTVADSCVSGVCKAGLKKVCDDKSGCTIDSCAPKTGCVFDGKSLEGKPCDADGSVCTDKDACKGGKCVAGPALCDDNNACALEPCDAKTGCLPKLKSGLNPKDINGLSPGYDHTCAVTLDGRTHCWGTNPYGNLGVGTTSKAKTNWPVRVRLGEIVKQVSAGHNYSCAVTNGGKVWCWGYNGVGQLGDGSKSNRALPSLVTGLKDVVQVKVNNRHTCVATKAGTVSCWGLNSLGGLGDGTKTHRSSPVMVTGLSGAVSVGVGDYHSCALLTSGLVKCWGRNGWGQLGDGTKTDRYTPVSVKGVTDAVALAVGNNHSCALRKAGTLVCWGYNGYGQLGNGTTTKAYTATAVVALSGVSGVGAGRYHTCALQKTTGNAYCWGRNSSGQLGNSSSADQLKPRLVTSATSLVKISTSWDTSCGLRSGGLAPICWGKQKTPSWRTPCDNDGSACTLDSCISGVCVPQKSVSCDDKNPCTVDSCDPKTGACSHAAMADGAKCDDGVGDGCTKQDLCKAGKCVAGGAQTCTAPLTQCKSTSKTSYACVCKAGYEMKQGKCVDIDECKDATLYSCPTAPVKTSCSNTAGSYTCVCPTGYSTVSSGKCLNVDECAELSLSSAAQWSAWSKGFNKTVLRPKPVYCPSAQVVTRFQNTGLGKYGQIKPMDGRFRCAGAHRKAPDPVVQSWSGWVAGKTFNNPVDVGSTTCPTGTVAVGMQHWQAYSDSIYYLSKLRLVCAKFSDIAKGDAKANVFGNLLQHDSAGAQQPAVLCPPQHVVTGAEFRVGFFTQYFHRKLTRYRLHCRKVTLHSSIQHNCTATQTCVDTDGGFTCK